MPTLTIPLFPLQTVLFPRGILPLRIFERRYLDMVTSCLKSESCFGVCLIRDGTEVGTAAEAESVGTLARIVDWESLQGGILGITCRGETRFRVLSHEVGANQLLSAEVELIADDPRVDIPPELAHLPDLLRQLLPHAPAHQQQTELEIGDAAWVGYRLAEIIPSSPHSRQTLLETVSPLQRLGRLDAMVRALAAQNAPGDGPD